MNDARASGDDTTHATPSTIATAFDAGRATRDARTSFTARTAAATLAALALLALAGARPARAEGAADLPTRSVSAEISAEISIEVDVPLADVAVDGAPVGRSPLGAPLVVAAGHHVVVAKTPGGTVVRRDVDVDAGSTAAVVLRSVPLDPAAIGYDAPLGTRSLATAPDRDVALVVTGGLAVLTALGTGIVATVLADDRAAAARRERADLMASGGTSSPCATPAPSAGGACGALRGDVAARDTLSNVAAGGYVVAALAAGATLAYAFLPRESSSHHGSFAARPAPLVGAHMGGVTVVGAF